MSGIWTLHLLLYSAFGNAFITEPCAIITPWKEDSNHRVEDQQLLWKATGTAVNTNLHRLPTIKHNRISSISAPASLHLPKSFRRPPLFQTGRWIYVISSLNIGLSAHAPIRGPLLHVCLWMRVAGRHIMHLHVAALCRRMTLIYNRDERSVHLIKQHISILLHSIG